MVALQEENKRLQTNLERVSAQWEGRVKRLEGKLKQYESGKEPSEVVSLVGVVVNLIHTHHLLCSTMNPLYHTSI